MTCSLFNGCRYNTHARFATLTEYFEGVLSSKEAQEQASAGDTPGTKIPVLTGSFFTYADKELEYWSGYYTSGPFYKRMVRDLQGKARAAELLNSLLGAPGGRPRELAAAKQGMALFQHHDAITGTSKNAVVNDYGQILHSAMAGIEQLLGRDLTALLHGSGVAVSSLRPSQARAAHQVQESLHSLACSLPLRVHPRSHLCC